MKCPHCKSGKDLFLSRSGNQNLFGLKKLWSVAVRCHRCCHLFYVAKTMARGLSESSTQRLPHHHRRHRAAS